MWSKTLAGKARRMGLAASLAAGLAACACAQPADTNEWAYQVAPGDTLIGLTDAYLKPGLGWQKLQQLNKVADPYRLPPGKTLRMPLEWLRTDVGVAEVVLARGDASYVRNGDAQPLASGAALQVGDTVRTGAQSSVSIRFADATRLLVAPQSQVRIDRLLVLGKSGLTDTRLRLEQGSADSSVPPGRKATGYRIETPALNLGVRGTEFRVHSQGSQSQVEVLQGGVGAAGTVGATQAVGAGFGLALAAGSPAAAPQRLLDAPDLGAATTRLERLPLRPTWGAQPGARGYRAQVLADGDDNQQLLLDGRFSEPAATWADLPDGRYRLRVRGIDAQGLEGRDNVVALVVKARPEPPFTVAPTADATLYGEQVALAWTQSAVAARYHLQVAGEAGFATPVADLPELAAPRHGVALPPGRYQWRLAAITASGDHGPWGDPQGFTLKPVPPSPPAEPPQVDDKAIVFRWRSAPGASYQVQIARDAEFSQPLVDRRQTEAQARIDNPEPGTYHMRVRTIAPDGYAGPWGTPQQVEVPRSRWWLILPFVLPLLAL